jgi:hypothetical protein
MARAQGPIDVVTVVRTAKKTLEQLDKFALQQWPFALALALTRTAQMGQDAVQQKTRMQFGLHTQFVPRGVRTQAASKSDIRTFGLAEANVHTAQRIADFMPVHELGGTRTPVAGGSGTDKGKSIALPAYDLEDKKFRTATGKIAKRWKPSTLLKDYTKRTSGTKVVAVSRGGRKGKPFIIRGRASGVPMIVRRRGKSQYPLELLYIFSRRATYKPVWDFAEEVERTVDAHFVDNLTRAVTQAFATLPYAGQHGGRL